MAIKNSFSTKFHENCCESEAFQALWLCFIEIRKKCIMSAQMTFKFKTLYTNS